MVTERLFIEQLRGRQQDAHGRLLKAIGDDCAVLVKDEKQVQLLTTDTLVEGVHFDLSFHPWTQLGRKIAAVNISDIAAMGGQPLYGQLSVALSPSIPEQGLQQLMDGFLTMCQHYGVALSGGDTVSSPCASFTVTLLGEMAKDKLLLRSGAKAGDELWVSGPLGLAAGGLALLQQGHERQQRFNPLYQAHLDPTPRLELGRFLADTGQVTAMQDISDGLATDLAHLCQASGVAGHIEAASLPLRRELEEAAQLCSARALDWALRGGEDFELLLSVPAGAGESLAAQAASSCQLQLSRIGVLEEGSGVWLHDGARRQEISYQGYEHGVG